MLIVSQNLYNKENNCLTYFDLCAIIGRLPYSALLATAEKTEHSTAFGSDYGGQNI